MWCQRGRGARAGALAKLIERLFGATRRRLTVTYSDAGSVRIFYEALFTFAQRKIPFGPDYEQWREDINVRMHEGKELYLLGAPNSDSESRTRPHATRKRTKP
jgi:hypothetical protein